MFAAGVTTAASFTSFLPDKIAGDISFWLVFIAAGIVFGLVLGRSRMVSTVAFSYIALSIVRSIPEDIFAFSPLYGQTIAFVGLLVVMVLVKDSLFEIEGSGIGGGFIWSLLVGFLLTGMLLSIIVSFVAKKAALGYVSAPTYAYFADPWFAVFWLVFPLFVLFFLNRRG